MEACGRGRWTKMLFFWSKGPSVLNRKFMFSILVKFKSDLLKRMIYNARKFRAIDAVENKNDFDYISN